MLYVDYNIRAADIDKTIYVYLEDSTTGQAKTGLAYNSPGAVASYVLPGAARAAITLATQTVTGAHSDGGFVEVDGTNAKGVYRLDLPDAAIASGDYTIITLEFDGTKEFAVTVPLDKRVDLSGLVSAGGGAVSFDASWSKDQQNEVVFVLKDSAGNVVSGLGTGFAVELAKSGEVGFTGSGGTKAEIGSGWYSYTSSAGEADTLGPVALNISHASVETLRLGFVVQARNSAAVEFTYTLTDSIDTSPIDGATVVIATNVETTDVVWAGTTDSLGVARDENSNKPWLDPGTYYIRASKNGYTFPIDTEVVA